jgi:DNA ligase (NAD+)
LDRLIVALGIRHVGEETARALAQWIGERYGAVKTLAALRKELASLSPEIFAEIDDVGTVVAESMSGYFASDAARSMFDRLDAAGLTVVVPRKKQGALNGKTLVVTGTLPTLSREDAEALIREHGGTAGSAVSAKTDYLVAGEKAGSKLTKATSLGVPVIDETGLYGLVR